MTNEPDGDSGDAREAPHERAADAPIDATLDAPMHAPPHAATHEASRAGVTRVTSIGVSPIDRARKDDATDDAHVAGDARDAHDPASDDASERASAEDADVDSRRAAGRHLDRTVLRRPPPGDAWARLRVEGLSAAAVAAAATGGALVAFGLREGGALDAFTGAGRRMLDIAATEGGAASLRALLAGLGAHLLVCLLWGFLFAALATRRRPWRAALTALLLAGAVYSASDLWLPAVLRLGYGLYATRPQHLLLHLLLAGGLWVGTRLAQYRPRSA